jgi:TPR repeat protein
MDITNGHASLAALLVLAPVTGFAGNCSTAIGQWSWFTGGRVIVEGNQVLKYNGVPFGRWECSNDSLGQLTLRWNTGTTDIVTLSADGRGISGKNHVGMAISGTRVGNPPATAPTKPASTSAAQPKSLSDYLTTTAKKPEPQPAPAATAMPQVTKPKEFHYDAETDALFDRSLKVYDAGNRPAALPGMRQAAERGHARAQSIMGIVYREGNPVPKNPQTAAYWFEKAAAQGHRAAAYHLGNMYELGEGVPQNHVLTVKYYDIASRQGFHLAQFELAFHHEFAQGTPRNRQLAIFWLTEAQKQGDGLAGWVASFLRNPRTPHFQNAKQLRNYMDAQVTAWVARITPGGGGRHSSGGGESGSSSGGDGCGGYQNYGACNAHKAGNDWAADRLERGGSTPSERDWYGR